MFDFKNCYFLRRAHNISLMEIRAIEILADFFKKKYGVKPEITTEPLQDKCCIKFDLLADAQNYDEYSVYCEEDTIFVKGLSTEAVNYAINRLIEIFTYFNDLSQLPFGSKIESNPEIDGYKLIYAEEFDGENIPRGWMKHPPVNIGARGNENTKGIKKECWINDDNYIVKDGKLTLFGSTDGEKYYSAELRTSMSLLYKYGYVEISAKVCDGRGGCSAFWLLGLEDPLEYVKPEIDIFEVFGDGSYIKATSLVWPGKNNKDFAADSWAGNDLNHINHMASGFSFYSLPNGEKLSDGYHTYGLEWDEHHLIWYCDGNPFYRMAIDDFNSKRAASFHQEMFIILTQYAGAAVAGRMDYPDENPDWDNMKMLVDYVRLYQREGQQVNGRVTSWSDKRRDNIFGQADRWKDNN